jgi:uncharacterized protein (AIM24 family)
MDYKIESKHRSDILQLSLGASDSFKLRTNAVSMYGGAISMDTTTSRSILKAITTYENFPVTKISTKEGKGGVATVSPPIPGDIIEVRPQNQKIKIQSIGFVGCSEDVSIDLNTGGIYSYDNIGMLTLEDNINSDECKIFIVGCEGVSHIELSENQRTNVKTDNILAMDEEVKTKEVSESGFKKRALGAGDDTFLRLTGPGNVYTHVRNPMRQYQTLSKVLND